MLPKLDAPTYRLTLPSTGEEIQYRPFLVKEQKLLMMAQESEDDNGKPIPTDQMYKEHIEDTTSILLEEGDAVIYKGCEIVHWREPYNEGTKLAQVFLNYVDANGKFTEWDSSGEIIQEYRYNRGVVT